MLNRTARAKTQFPRRRIFSLSVRCGSACAQYRGQTRRCQRKRQRRFTARNLCGATLPDRFHRRFTMTFALDIRGLCKSFDRPAVDRPRPHGAAGEFYSLLGPNGAGKTTTLRMVAGLLPPDAGTIRICGIDALRDPVAAKRIVAWVSDEPMIYDKLTPYEYLEFVAGLWSLDAERRRGARARADGLARACAARARALRGLLQGHAPEGGARGRAGARPARDHPRRAADRPRRRLGAAGQARAARAGRRPAAP